MTTITPPQAVAVPSPVARPKRRRRRRWPIVVVAAIVVLVVLFGLWRLFRGGSGSAAAVDPSDVVQVTKGTVERTVESAGRVVSNADVEIKCRAGGAIVKLPFDINQHVKIGDLVCQLDKTDEQLNVRAAEASYEQAAAKLAQAKENLETGRLNLGTTRTRVEAAMVSAHVRAANLQFKADRQRELIAQRLGSKEEYESAQTEAAAAEADEHAAQATVDELKQQQIQLEYKANDVRTAEAALQQNKIQVDSARQNLAYTTVLAPIDGTVSKVDANVGLGTVVASGTGGFSGGTTIMTLSDLSRMFVMATVDQSDFGGVRVGQAARVKVDAYPDRTFDGTVMRLPTTGVSASNVVTFEVKVEVTDAHKDLLKPEMTGTVTIVEDGRPGVLRVPTAAVSRQAGKAFVTTADGKHHDVTLGLIGSDQIEIKSGVTAGEDVVIASDDLPTRWKNDDGGRR